MAWRGAGMARGFGLGIRTRWVSAALEAFRMRAAFLVRVSGAWMRNVFPRNALGDYAALGGVAQSTARDKNTG